MSTVGTVAPDAVWASGHPAAAASGSVRELVRGLLGAAPRWSGWVRHLLRVAAVLAAARALPRSAAWRTARRPALSAAPVRPAAAWSGGPAVHPASRERSSDEVRSVELPADPSAPRRARALLRLAALDWDVDDDVQHDAAMVATELVANAVDHARTGSTFTVRRDGAALRVMVRDGSPGAAPQPRPMDPSAARGRGLQMVDALATEWGVVPDRGGKTVWALLAPHPDRARDGRPAAG